MPRSGAEYYRAINQQKCFAHSVGLDSQRFTYPYSSYKEYCDDKSSHYYNADLKLVKSNSVGKHHEDCDEPECGTSDWYCDLCSDLNVDVGSEPAGVSEVYAGCGWSSVQCMLLLECDDEVSPIPHSGGTERDDGLQLDCLRTDGTPVPISDEYEPAVAKFAEDLDCDQPDILSIEFMASFESDFNDPKPVPDQRVTTGACVSDFNVAVQHPSPSPKPSIDTRVVRVNVQDIIILCSTFLIMCLPVVCVTTNSFILAKASLLTIALFPYTIIFVFDRGKYERGFS